MCPMCQLAETQARSPDRRCAFDDSGTFRSDNKHCLTMLALRVQAFVAFSVKLREEDSYARVVVLGHDGRFVLAFWKDQSASIDHAVMLSTSGVFHVERLTLQVARDLLDARARSGELIEARARKDL